MPIYEKRTYDIHVGKMSEVVSLYTDGGYAMFEAGGFAPNLIGYFISDTGPLHQLIHIWRFEDDADRRSFWDRLYAYEPFGEFGASIRPLIKAQEVQLLKSAPWGPTP